MTTKALKEFGQINGNFLRDTFNTLTISKIKYGGELCFWDNLLSINQIQYQFYKRFCHLKTTTPNYCLIGEFGIQPLEFHFYKGALRYWLRLLVADNRNLIKKFIVKSLAISKILSTNTHGVGKLENYYMI